MLLANLLCASSWAIGNFAAAHNTHPAVKEDNSYPFTCCVCLQ
uniref:Uncharacterized protein n=1 Tax=Phakopsora pachyrhizi TaxID=170000 RepID=A0A0S1MIJ1_PHAPC